MAETTVRGQKAVGGGPDGGADRKTAVGPDQSKQETAPKGRGLGDILLKDKSGPELVTSRRRIVGTSIIGFLLVNFLMFLRFFFPRTLFEPKTVFRIGYPAAGTIVWRHRLLAYERR